MINNPDITPSGNRLIRSARVLKAYFEHKLKLKLELLTEAPAETLIDGMQFDLQIGGWGIWGLRSSGPLPEKTQSEISAAFHGLLGGLDVMEKRAHDLSVLEAKYRTALEDLPSNVIPLRRPAPAPRPRVFYSARDRRWILKQDCLIESKSADDIQKMALELHSHSQRVAFVHYNDLEQNVRLNLSELINVGEVTLFVPNIVELKKPEQEVLRKMIETDPDERPLVIAGANMNYSELRTEPAIDLQFLLLLSRAYIKLTRPFSEYKEQGLIHYFLDSLAQNPS